MESEKPPATLRRKLSGRLLILFSILAIFIFTAVLYTSADYISVTTPNLFPLFTHHPSQGFSSPDPEISQSKHLGGLPGFQVLQNVWVHNGTIYLFAPDRSKFPSKSRAVSGQTGWEVFTHPSHDLLLSARGAYILEGTSIFINEGAKIDEWHYLSSYYHLVSETLLGSLSSLASVPLPSSGLSHSNSVPIRTQMHIPTTTARGKVVPALPDRVVIPWKGAEGWRDEAGWGEMVLSALWGDRGGERARGEGGGDEKQRIAGVIEPEDWDILSNLGNEHKGWVFMERAIITDRWASHRHNQLSLALNKMAASVFVMPKPVFWWTEVRRRFLGGLGFGLEMGERDVPGGMLSFPPPSSLSLSTTKANKRRIKRTTPKLIYMLDQSSTAERKLSEQSALELEGMLGEMEGKGMIDVVHLWIGKSDYKSHNGRQNKGIEDKQRQIKEVIDADIVLSVHGEMLTHQVWMPEGGVVIELFPNESFLPENQIVADVLLHEYIPVWYDRALSREEWDALPAQYEHGKLYDGTEITVDKVYMRLLLEEVVGRMRSK
ncbi:expressed protein [Cryptococcus deneoformans JEC21]|uniref:Expressed protein n=1 Tax=Cryptococcus deneoformans (strain JEC21 / ATCC MYA-565) TaxID=214684 RepID=Q5KJB3_CRYD1|nr:expressed protein [Cryptococcus neoformans var. neoformans JEC21]AAW42530.2 expressed protein [Cryptococcus neoformans var. neoformans JEC21]